MTDLFNLMLPAPAGAALSGHGVLFDATEYARGVLSGHGVLSVEVPSPLELTWFPVTGYFSAVAGTLPATQKLSSIVTFTPRLLKDELLYVDGAAVTLRPMVAVIWNGVLCTAVLAEDTIDDDDDAGYVPGFKLPANTFGLGELIFDVAFTAVTFNKANQSLAPFAFVAPTDATPVNLTDPDLLIRPYQLPNQQQWTPPPVKHSWNRHRVT